MRDLFNIQAQHEVIQVALKVSNTEHALEVEKLKQEMSSVVIQNTKLQENYKNVCVELADVNEKMKSLEEHIGVLQTQVHMYTYTFEMFLVNYAC